MVSLAVQQPGNMELIPTMLLRTPQRQPFSFSFEATTPPPTDLATIMQRADEVNTLQRMLSDAETNVVTLTGYAGAGKSILAALLYQQMRLAAQSGLPAPKHLVWLRVGPYSTLPDVVAAILSRVNTVHDPAIFLQTPEQQITALIRALSRPQEPALVILDAFDRFLDSTSNLPVEGRGAIALFLERLQSTIGGSRVLLICNRSPYNPQEARSNRARSYFVSRISIPEGIALLQQRGVQGSYEELSLAWQRCAGHAYSLVLFSTLCKLSRFPIGYYVQAPESQYLWNGEVVPHLIAAVYRALSPLQRTLLRALCLFDEPVTWEGLKAVMSVGQLWESGQSRQSVDLVVTEQELNTLLQLSLVQQTVNRHAAPCFFLHPLLHQYVAAHYLLGIEQPRQERFATSLGVVGPITPPVLDSETQDVALAAAHMHVADYYQKQIEEQYIPREKRHSVQDIEPILATIRHRCHGWHWQVACDLVFREGLYESMVQWGAWDTLVNLYALMLPPSGVLTRRDEGLVNNHLGLLYGRLGDYQRSYLYYEEALALQRKIGDAHGEATSLTNEGEMFRAMGDFARARENFQQVLSLNTTLRDPLVDIIVQHNLGLLYHGEKHYAEALRCYQDALQLAEKAREEYNKGTILTNIGVLLFEQGYRAESLAVMLYVLKRRERLHFHTHEFLQSFIETLEHHLGIEGYDQLRKTALSMQEQVMAQLTTGNAPVNMRSA